MHPVRGSPVRVMSGGLAARVATPYAAEHRPVETTHSAIHTDDGVPRHATTRHAKSSTYVPRSGY